MVFLGAGFETTSLKLAQSTYELAKHRDIQLKLQNEIDQHWKDDQEQIDYDIINDLKYLDIFIKEVLRMFSNTHRVLTRVCSQPTIVSGHLIEKGLNQILFIFIKFN
jgi:cytochrome P450 family 6